MSEQKREDKHKNGLAFRHDCVTIMFTKGYLNGNNMQHKILKVIN